MVQVRPAACMFNVCVVDYKWGQQGICDGNPPELSLPINNQVPFDVTTMSKVALFLHQLWHVNPPAVLSP